MKKIYWLAISILVVAAAFVFSNTPQQKTEEAALTIGYSKLRISLPIFVAQEQGFFTKHGLKINLQPYETAQPLMQALISGQIDIAGYTAFPITYNGMLRSGKPLYFLTTLLEDQEHRLSYLLRPKTPKGQEPSIKTLADLSGKTIGILPTIAYKAWLEAILKKNNIDLRTVTIQQIAPLQQAQALKTGGVDALFTNDPAATSAIQAGAAELLLNEVEAPTYIQNPFPFGSFNIAKAWADENPEHVKKLRLALDEAVQFVNQNPEAAKHAMAPYIPEKFRTHIPHYPAARYLTSAQTTQTLLQSTADTYVKIGIIPQPPDLSGLVYNK